MSFRLFRIPAASVLSTMLLAVPALAQSHPAEPASPYGGITVEEIIARVNDQIITKSDYDRAMKELDDEMRQHGATMQQMSEAHKDLLRNLIDQQLWLSKGKELGITGETELITKLDEIRKQYNLASLEDLEKAAQEQGVSFEDFKSNIRNQIITQEVMRQEVGAHINFTPGEVQRYYEQHQEQYQQPESVKLSEILVPTPQDSDDPAKISAAETKANDIETKLKGGADFAELARIDSAGQTAAQGGDLGTYKRGQLGAKVFEDAAFSLPTGGVTQPIRTRQGFVIFKVVQHTPAGVQPFKDVEQQVEQDYYESKMEPAIRDELNRMRDDAYLEIKPGYVDTGATGNKRINPISYAAYTPPAPKKKRKVERTRFRENAHFRSKTTMPTLENASVEKKSKNAKGEEQASEKPGKKEKIRFGQAPTKTLPNGPQTPVEDAGAGNAQVAQANEQDNPLQQAAPPEKKTRFSDRAREERKEKKSRQHQGKSKTDALAPAPPNAAEVADQQTQSASLGLAGDTSKKKKAATTTGQKTRLSDRKKDQSQQNSQPAQPTPIPAVQGAPAPSGTPANPPAPQQQ
jgi:peptidyl-prolyl cis-trans isomerase SurA